MARVSIIPINDSQKFAVASSGIENYRRKYEGVPKSTQVTVQLLHWLMIQ